MAMTTGSGRGPMADINVTPMVDVMLVLLIIFMVTAPLMQQGVAVELPETKAQAIDVNPDLVVLTITKDQHYFIGQTEIAYDQLHDKISSNIKLREDKNMYLHADRRLPYGVVVDVMAMMKDAGVDNLGMVTDPLSSRRGRKK